MIDLREWLATANVPVSDFADTIGITVNEVMEIIDSDDDTKKEETYMLFCTLANNEGLSADLKEFYVEFIDDENTLESFISTALKPENNLARRMVNMVHRHITLSDDLIKLGHNYDTLRLFNLIVAIEATYKLSGSISNKTDMVIDFFKNHIEEHHKTLIHNNVRLTYEGKEYSKEYTRIKATTENFSRILCCLRNDYVHEGIYWNFSFAKRDGYSMLNTLDIKLPSLSDKKENYCIVTNLSFNVVRKIIILGIINFIQKYMKKL